MENQMEIPMEDPLNNHLILQAMEIIFESSDEEVDDLLLIDQHRCEVPRIGIDYYAETIANRYDAHQFQQTFRVRRSTFDYLLFFIGPRLTGFVNDYGRRPLPPQIQLLAALRMLGTPDTYKSVTMLMGICETSCWRALYHVVSVLYEYRNYFIRWPTAAEAEETATRIQAKCGIPDIMGAVDGTHIGILAPRRDRASYYNRNKYASIHCQVACNDRLQFIHCFSGFPGSVHDMRVFKHSGLQHMCNEEYFYGNKHLIADSAYTLQQHIITPYKAVQPLTPEQRLFNLKLSSVRSMVECSIGLLKQRWRRLLYTLDMKRYDLIPFYIYGCCVLHNISLLEDDELVFDIVIPEVAPREVVPLEPTRLACQIGRDKREDFRRQLNQNL